MNAQAGTALVPACVLYESLTSSKSGIKNQPFAAFSLSRFPGGWTKADLQLRLSAGYALSGPPKFDFKDHKEDLTPSLWNEGLGRLEPCTLHWGPETVWFPGSGGRGLCSSREAGWCWDCWGRGRGERNELARPQEWGRQDPSSQGWGGHGESHRMQMGSKSNCGN